MFYNSDVIRDKLSVMKKGEGYFDFGKAQCAFALDGEFKIYFKHKFRNQTNSLKEAVSYMEIVLN